MRIVVEDPSQEDIVALLQEHLSDMHATSPAESVHALDVEALRHPGILFVAARDAENRLLGVGALREISADHGEIKSMRTARYARRQGVADGILHALAGVARARRYERLSLETGSDPYFEPAHRLYETHGFEPTGPFDGYAEDPHSRFFSKALEILPHGSSRRPSSIALCARK